MTDDVFDIGRDLIRRSLCPACYMTGGEQRLEADPPGGFHYHTDDLTTLYDPPRLWCPVDGQGYRLEGGGLKPDIKITPPCNGGVHSDGYVGYR